MICGQYWKLATVILHILRPNIGRILEYWLLEVTMFRGYSKYRMSPASGWMAMQIALAALQKTISTVLDGGLYLGERGIPW